MPKIVVLGSCRHEPYKVLIMPNKLDPELYANDQEKAYDKACEKFYPAMDEADIILVYNPDGKIGEHTQRDIDYALAHGKKVVYTNELTIRCRADGRSNPVESSPCEKKWKEYPNKMHGPMLHGGDGPYKDGHPSDGPRNENGFSDYITYHTGGLPFWDWVENEDGTWCWLGRGQHGRAGEGPVTSMGYPRAISGGRYVDKCQNCRGFEHGT